MPVAYPAIVHHEDGQYWIEFPDLPGCFSSSDSLPALLTNASEALGLMLCECSDRSEPFPAPSDISSLRPADGFSTMVIADPYKFKKDTRSVKKTLTIPAWLNAEAEAAHVNFSQILQDGLKSYLQTT